MATRKPLYFDPVQGQMAVIGGSDVIDTTIVPWSAPTQTRLTAVHTTIALNQNASEQSTIVMTKSYRVLRLSMNFAARVRLYDRLGKQAQDVNRSAGGKLPTDSGLVMDFVGSSSLLTGNLNPQAIGDNMEGTPSTSIPITVTNLSGQNRAITVTLTYVVLG